MSDGRKKSAGANVYMATGRRSPRIGTFALVGALLGAVGMLAWGFAVGEPHGTTVLVLLLTGAFVGSLVIGALAALWDYLAERMSKRAAGEQKSA
ncbi:hypothetical protein KRX56_01870 [Dermabacteraceae bacterium TAE3-ERU27]|nr:hypothetical protein [Dermabacteraceae bacterium TAE3-ERU27]